jgi:rhodanese-related sulfurtransferase
MYLRFCFDNNLYSLIYCSGGYRGNIAADELNKQGFDAVTIEGGYSAYKEMRNKKKKDSNSNE